MYIGLSSVFKAFENEIYWVLARVEDPRDVKLYVETLRRASQHFIDILEAKRAARSEVSPAPSRTAFVSMKHGHPFASMLGDCAALNRSGSSAGEIEKRSSKNFLLTKSSQLSAAPPS